MYTLRECLVALTIMPAIGRPPGDRTQQERVKKPSHAPANACGPIWCARRGSNSHGFPTGFEAVASAYSATRAYWRSGWDSDPEGQASETMLAIHSPDQMETHVGVKPTFWKLEVSCPTRRMGHMVLQTGLEPAYTRFVISRPSFGPLEYIKRASYL